MDAKRIIPILQVAEGAVQDAPGGLPAECAGRLEMAGADEILFLENARPRTGQAPWIREVAQSLFIPFGVACDLAQGSQVDEALELGADKVILRIAPLELPRLASAALKYGRHRIMVAVTASWSPEHGWRVPMPLDPTGRDAVEWMVELGQMGAGEILVATGAQEGLGALCRSSAQLALPVLFHCQDRARGLEALLHGADGLAFAADQGAPGDLKAFLGGRGLVLRQ